MIFVVEIIGFGLYSKFDQWRTTTSLQPRKDLTARMMNASGAALAPQDSSSISNTPKVRKLAPSPRDRTAACLPLMWHIKDLVDNYMSTHIYYTTTLAELLKENANEAHSEIVKNALSTKACGEMTLRKMSNRVFLLEGHPPFYSTSAAACTISILGEKVNYSPACEEESEYDDPEAELGPFLDRVQALAKQEAMHAENSGTPWDGITDDRAFMTCFRALGKLKTLEEVFFTDNDRYANVLDDLINIRKERMSSNYYINKEELVQACKNVQLFVNKDKFLLDKFLLTGETQTRAFCRLIVAPDSFCHEGNCGSSMGSAACTLDSALIAEGMKTPSPHSPNPANCPAQLSTAQNSQMVFFKRNHRFSSSFSELENFTKHIYKKPGFQASPLEKACGNPKIYINRKMVLMTGQSLSYSGCTYIALVSKNRLYKNNPEFEFRSDYSSINVQEGICDSKWGTRSVSLGALLKAFDSIEK